MPLNNTKIKNIKLAEKPFKLADGEGMFLLVNPNGSKYWRLKYRFAGKEKSLALGTYPTVSLKEAREARTAAKKLLARGTDPSDVKRAQKAAINKQAENSFQLVALEWHTANKPKWSKSHAFRAIQLLERDILHIFAHREH